MRYAIIKLSTLKRLGRWGIMSSEAEEKVAKAEKTLRESIISLSVRKAALCAEQSLWSNLVANKEIKEI